MTTMELPFSTRTEIRAGRTFQVTQWGSGKNDRSETEIITRNGRTFELTQSGRRWIAYERHDADTYTLCADCTSFKRAMAEIDWACPVAVADDTDEDEDWRNW